MKVNATDFLSRYCSEEYHNGIFIPFDIFLACTDAEFQSIDSVELPDDIFLIIERNKENFEKSESLESKVSDLRLLGMRLEKLDPSAAINAYIDCIKIGETGARLTSYAHAYERLIVLLHKSGDFVREVSYLTNYLSHKLTKEHRIKYSERLERLKKKIGGNK